jgi:hypothetical protein
LFFHPYSCRLYLPYALPGSPSCLLLPTLILILIFSSFVLFGAVHFTYSRTDNNMITVIKLFNIALTKCNIDQITELNSDIDFVRNLLFSIHVLCLTFLRSSNLCPRLTLALALSPFLLPVTIAFHRPLPSLHLFPSLALPCGHISLPTTLVLQLSLPSVHPCLLFSFALLPPLPCYQFFFKHLRLFQPCPQFIFSFR